MSRSGHTVIVVAGRGLGGGRDAARHLAVTGMSQHPIIQPTATAEGRLRNCFLQELTPSRCGRSPVLVSY